MSFVLGLWLLFGFFFANIPTTSSIQCYRCADYPGSQDPCEGSSAIQCESLFDSCVTIKIKVEFASMDFDETFRNCTQAEAPACNQTLACQIIEEAVVKAGGKLLECDVTCCHTDRCNGPDEGEPKHIKPGLYPQSEFKHYIETVRALLDEMEYIVDNDLEGLLSTTEYKGRVKEVLNDFYLAITNDEDEKPNNVMDELKTNAAELMKELETKRGQSKKKHAEMRQKKIEAKTYKLLSEVMESLARTAAQKR